MKTLAAALAVLTTLSLGACTNDPNATETQPENPNEITIVTSTPIWADIAQTVADSAQVEVEVISAIEDPNVDPHHFDPSAKDIAQANEADVVVVGGGGYDAWLYQAVSDQDKIITALPLVDHGTLDEFVDSSRVPVIDGNEHIWYEVEAINAVGEDVATAINEVNPEAKASAAGLKEKTAGFNQQVAALPPRTFAQTEPIADYLLHSADWQDLTPAGYRAATIKEGEPSVADLAAFLDALEAKKIDVLINNPQTSTDMTRRLVEAAKKAGIPVIDIGETPLEGENFFSYYQKVLDDLTQHA